ncbi:MAG: 16S rRNA (cytidine(1402)-2'-O)-methyltransferase [Candidatus Falkowbacteria bacterium]|nr:16S rRNA (cytidine(1402)-2'-O)-methyltransferase [Candidatus Falkowbacteria bacterium]
MPNLYIVATPIGNLEDVTLRSLRILKEVGYVLSEDTRVGQKLLNHYEIKTPLISYHHHSGQTKLDKIFSLLEANHDLALITDAGTPGIADPGGQLVAAVRDKFGATINIVPIPGVSAVTTLLSVAGIAADKFWFYGFLPHKKGRQTALKEIAACPYPVVIYESKHRILKLLSEFEPTLKVIIGRELTKLHESFYFAKGGVCFSDL